MRVFSIINKKKEFEKLGGHTLLYHHYPSFAQLLIAVYPEYSWEPWKFNKAPKGYFDNVENQKSYVKWLEQELKIKEKSDWYKFTAKVEKSGGFG